MSKSNVQVYMVVAGDYHDMDFARLELLKLLAEDERIRVHVAQDFHNVEAMNACDWLVTYTCNLLPEAHEQEALRDFVAGGKKWFALHGTNSILQFLENGKVDSPEKAPILMETLGSQFIAHPPIQPFKVQLADPEHELVKGVAEFETDDELYLSRIHGPLHMLLETRYVGKAEGFAEEDWDEDVPRPVYYIKQVGDGEVLYLNLGHCRGHYDMEPLMAYYPQIERGSWAKPEFYELLRRGIRYCTRGIA